MIVYKCDLCGVVVPANDLVTIHAAAFDVSKCFEICPKCYKEIADKAKATAAGKVESLFADGVKIAERLPKEGAKE